MLQKAIEITHKLESILKPDSLPLPPVHRRLIPATGSNVIVTAVNQNLAEIMSAISSYYFMGLDSDEESIVKLGLLYSIIKKPIFDQLRYVISISRQSRPVSELCIGPQSS